MVPLNFRGVPGLRFSQCILLSGCQGPAVITSTRLQSKGVVQGGSPGAPARLSMSFVFVFL